MTRIGLRIGVFCALVGLLGALPAFAQCPGCNCSAPDLKITKLTCAPVGMSGSIFRATAEIENCGAVDVGIDTVVEFVILEQPPFDGRVKRKKVGPIPAGATVTVSATMNTGSFSNCSATVDVLNQVAECHDGTFNTATDCPFLDPQSCSYCDAGFGIPLPYETSAGPPLGCTPCC